ncbi:hypothetical protein GGR52DRAFT_389726 [Hypoxylon sp. FL1284]|nr:hypothetical protein GGR52DRAFT_389726 [Hypoxylon sp. FL1284]
MTSHQKSCLECAKSKRRCEPQTPQCPRCARIGLDCVYKNPPVKDLSQHLGRKRARRGQAHLNQPSSDGPLSSAPSGDVVPVLGEASPRGTKTREISGKLSVSPIPKTHQPLYRQLWSPGFHPGSPVQPTINRLPLKALMRNVTSWPTKFVQRLEAPFIHASLRNASILPPPLEAAFGACATYLTKTPKTKDMVMGIIERRVLQLIDLDLSILSIESHLACLQAFLLLHIIQLWDGDARQRAQAEMQSYTIENWALMLHMRVTEASKEQDTPLDWTSWVTLESARRTTLLTLLAQGIYEMHKYGVCSCM